MLEKELAARGITKGAGDKLLGLFTGLIELEKAAQIVSNERVGTLSDTLNAATLGRLVEFVGGEHESIVEPEDRHGF